MSAFNESPKARKGFGTVKGEFQVTSKPTRLKGPWQG
jgi:hypothetical protein